MLNSLYTDERFVYDRRGVDMINFDEELKKYRPSAEVENLEDVVNKQNLTDMTDIMREMLKDRKEK